MDDAPGARAPMSERRKRGRLSRSGDFDRVFRDGRSRANRYLVLYSFRRSDEQTPEEVRLGISVGRRVGGAVERTAVKRALREAFWSLDPGLPGDHDYVLVARPDLRGLVEREGTAGVNRTLRELIADSDARAA